MNTHLAVAHRRQSVLLLLLTVLAAAPPPAGAVTDRTPGAFEVSATGEATYTFPLKLPPGTSGMTPSLSFVYGSQRGNGLLGLGVRIVGFSAITRCMKTIAQDNAVAPVLYDATDKLCLDGNRLRLTGGTYGASGAVYQTEIDTFARISQNTAGLASGLSWFEVKQKNGLIYEYGNSLDSRIERTGSANVVRLWALSKIRDRDGNAITFTYTEDNVNGTYRPNEIQYTSNPGQGLTAAYKIVFVYSARPAADPLVRYEDGYKSKETNRISRIDVLHNGTTIVRQFTPTYFGASSTSRTRIDVIDECGKNTQMCGRLFRLNWLTGSNALDGETSSGTSITAGSVVHTIDANGDGRLDAVYEAGGNWTVMWGQPSGGYTAPVSSGFAATNVATSHSIDFDSDGIRDVLFSDGTNWKVLQGSRTGSFTGLTTTAPATGASTGQIKVADVDGDGREDLVFVSGQILKLRKNTGAAFSATTSDLYTLAAGNAYPSNPFGVPGVEEYRGGGSGISTDFNGDGRSDILVQTTASGVTSWRTLLSLGTTYSASTLITSAAATRPLVLDINGDGYSDVVGQNGGNWLVYFAKGGNAVASLFESVLTTSVSAPLAGALAFDFDSDGHQDILSNVAGTWNVAYSTRENFAAPASIGIAATTDSRAVDVDGDGLVDLAFNGAGTWKFRAHSGNWPDLAYEGYDAFDIYWALLYRSLYELDVYTRDATPPFPAKHFTGRLPVVNETYIADGTGYNSYMLYSYWNANWHGQGRGFLGFTRFKDWQQNTDVGNWVELSQAFPYIGVPTLTGLRRGDHTTKVTESTMTLANVPNGAAGNERYFPYASQIVAKRWESDGTYHHQLISTATTDVLMSTYGVPYDVTTTTVEAASANGAQSGASYVNRVYTANPTNLVNDTSAANWCLGQRTQIQLIRSHNQYGGSSQTRTTNQTWDAAKCRVTTTVAEPGSSTRQVTTVLGFDGFGNVSSRAVTGKNPNGTNMAVRTTSISWGSSGHFPMTVTNPLSQATTYGYDFSLGTRTSTTDPNGIALSMVYDARGRWVETTNPDGTKATRIYTECANVSGGCLAWPFVYELVIVDKKLDTSSATLSEHWTYTDELLRPIVQKQYTLSGQPNRVDLDYLCPCQPPATCSANARFSGDTFVAAWI